MSAKKKPRGEPRKNNLRAARADADADKQKLWIVAAVIVIITFIIYIPVFSNGFVSLDDDQYVEQQPLIRSFDIKALFSTFVMGHYHPLVMMVYTILFHFFQLDPAGYHAFNLILHLVNTTLVLWLMYYLTGSLWTSAGVALLFGIHPTHVESVAWVSELKDLMYSLGYLLSLICYIRFIKENGKIKWYIYSLVFFLASLLSKSMAVSLSVILLLVDFYLDRKVTLNSLLEKVPFFIFSIIFSIINFFSQRSFGAMEEIDSFTFPQRIVFACYNFITYIIKLFVPLHLSAFYPYPDKIEGHIPGYYYAYIAVFIVLIGLIFYSLRTTRIIFFGIGFFSISIFPVLQLLAAGHTLMADRYEYISSIGILFILMEGLTYISEKIKNRAAPSVAKYFIPGVLGLMLLVFSFQARARVGVWENSGTLWSNVIENYPNVFLAHNNRGTYYRKKGELDKALADFNRAIELSPAITLGYINRGSLYQMRNELDKALQDFNRCIELDSTVQLAYSHRGLVFANKGKTEDAINDFSKAIKLQPDFAECYYNRGIAYYNLHRMNEACRDLKQAAQYGYPQSSDAVRALCR